MSKIQLKMIFESRMIYSIAFFGIKLGYLDSYLLFAIFFLSAPAHEIKLFYTKPYTDFINLTCTATGVFPEPEMKLSWGTLSTDRL